MATGRKRTMTVDIVVEDRQARQSLKNVDSAAQTTGDKFGKVGGQIKAAMGVVAAGAVAAFAVQMADRAGEIEGILRRVDEVFGENADEVKAWADENNEAFGVATTTLLGMASEIGDLLIPIGFTRDAAAEMATETLEAANALSEWTGGKVSVEEAAGAMTKAFLGEREELKKLGVALNEADIKARLAAKGQSELEGDARKAAVAVATQELIFEKSADALNAYAEGGDSVIRSQKELKAAVADARDELAQKLIPVFMAGMEAAQDFAAGSQIIIDWFEALPGALKAAVLGIGTFAVALKALYANPVIAGLALVATAIIKIGDEAREHRKNIDEFKELIVEVGGSAETAGLQILEARDDVNQLEAAAADVGLTLEDLTKAALGDAEAMEKVEQKMTAASDAGRVSTETLQLLSSAYNTVSGDLRAAQRELETLAEKERRANEDAGHLTEGTHELADKMAMGATQAATFSGDVDTLTVDFEELAGATDEARAAAVELANEQRAAVDPAFKLKKANDAYKAALATVAELQREGKTNTNEYRTAQLKLLEAQANLNFALASFDSTKSIEELLTLGQAAGLTEQDIRSLIKWIENYNNTPITGGGGGIGSPGPGPPQPPPGKPPVPLQTGGVVPGPTGSPVPVLAHAGEMVLNPQQQRALMRGGAGSGLTINVSAGTIITEAGLEDVIIRVMSRYGLRNGSR